MKQEDIDKLNNLYIDRRLGQFSITGSVILEQTYGAQVALQECVILGAEYSLTADLFIYTALHPEFEPVKIGTKIPKYLAMMHRSEDDQGNITLRREWRKI